LFVTPIATATLLTTGIGKAFYDSAWPLVAKLCWFAFIFFLATVATVRTKRAIDRFLPLSMLIRSNLSFPKAAPSRMKLSLRIGNTANRAEVVHDFREYGLSADPQIAAEQVLVLVEELNRHDRRTRGHSEKVRALSDVIGEELRLSSQERELLRWGSMLHDIGKLAVPAALLNKDTKPTDEEWETLKTHPAQGEWRLAALQPWLGDWVRCAWEHHERFDGTGYPKGIASSELPIGSRIVAVADAFEVMTSVRSYKKAMSYNEARAELARCAGTHFDPEVVRAFLKVGEKSNGYGSGFLSSLLHWLDSAQRLSIANLSAAASSVVSGATALVIGASATITPVPAAAPKPRKTPPVELALLEPTTTTTTTTSTTAASTTTTTTIRPVIEIETIPSTMAARWSQFLRPNRLCSTLSPRPHPHRLSPRAPKPFQKRQPRQSRSSQQQQPQQSSRPPPQQRPLRPNPWEFSSSPPCPQQRAHLPHRRSQLNPSR
jgi:HD-GYP domain-containing protein (c-di-GMP phosphodiesterase class II)